MAGHVRKQRPRKGQNQIKLKDKIIIKDVIFLP
jgi:hypothetical protein